MSQCSQGNPDKDEFITLWVGHTEPQRTFTVARGTSTGLARILSTDATHTQTNTRLCVCLAKKAIWQYEAWLTPPK